MIFVSFFYYIFSEAYQAEESLMESGTGSGINAPEPPPRQEIREDLQCSLCHDLLRDAVMIPCCGNSFCDECKKLFLTACFI